jgi:hypothetical protein
MKPKHTPGPWAVVEKTIVDAEGDAVIEVLSAFNADLNLAAAAPELLDALLKIRNNASLDISDIIAICNAGIAKATGGAE